MRLNSIIQPQRVCVCVGVFIVFAFAVCTRVKAETRRITHTHTHVCCKETVLIVKEAGVDGKHRNIHAHVCLRLLGGLASPHGGGLLGPSSTNIVLSSEKRACSLQPNRSVGGAVGLSKSLAQTRQATCLSSPQGIFSLFFKK